MYGIAIIGCGDMGNQHAAAWSARDDARVVAVCDPQADRAERLAQRYGALTIEQWQAAVMHEDVDIVSVCVPACDHYKITVAGAETGKHILCEKAMALNLDQADEMIAIADDNRVCFSVCHQYRSLSRFTKIKRLLDEGRLGNPLFIRFAEMREVRPKLAMHRLGMNGGPVHDMSGHLFDLGRYLTGREAISVSAVGSVFGKGKKRLESVSDLGIDTADIQLRFQGGHCLSIGINWGLPEGTPGHCHELIHGPLGMIYSIDEAHPDRFLGDITDSMSIVIKDASGSMRIECERGTNGPQPCIDELVKAIETGAPSQFAGTEGRAALRLVLASLESVDTGRAVDVS